MPIATVVNCETCKNVCSLHVIALLPTRWVHTASSWHPAVTIKKHDNMVAITCSKTGARESFKFVGRSFGALDTSLLGRGIFL
eukprot:1474448-Pyramimonas_sp.AAC.1